MIKKKRLFYPGEEWVCFKIYSGPNYLDQFLYNHILSFYQKFYSENIIDEFFFIRYRDPDFHLRLRFRLREKQSLGNFISAFYRIINPMIEESIIWKLELVGYEREIERYGEWSIELVEQFFWRDSIFILENIQKTERWMCAVNFMQYIFKMFHLNISDQTDFLRSISDNFMREYAIGKKTKIALDLKFREYKKTIETVLFNYHQHERRYRSYYDSTVYKLSGLLDLYEKEKRLSVIFSIIHMHINRIFVIDGRKKELVLYYLLNKYYTSYCAKNGKIEQEVS